MSSSKILFFLCVSFVLGIFLESLIKIPQVFIWGFLFLAILVILFTVIPGGVPFGSRNPEHKHKSWILAFARMTGGIMGFCILFFILGVLRMQISEFNIANDKLAKLNGKGGVVLTGVISDAPDVRETSQKLTVKIGESKVLVTTKNDAEYSYLDKVEITGKPQEPAVFDGFNYKNYLLKDGIYSVMSFPKVEIVSRAHKYNLFTYIYGEVLFLKQKLEQSVNDNFLPPHSLILDGIIFGNNKNMTTDLRDRLDNAGLRFLTAISGVHVIIISEILFYFLMFLRIGRRNAQVSSIFLIWFYVVLTGLTTSGIRAGIMGGIFILAGVLGRQNTSSRTIVLAASLMLLQNPLLLIYDIGFQLSFMACLGIIYLKPLLKYFVKSNIVSVTFAAQIITLPIMIYNFGTISLVAPITSILVLPAMELILSFGFLFSIFAAMSKFLGLILFTPTWLLAQYFIIVMNFFSQSWMAKTITNVSWMWILFAYAIIFSAIYFLTKKYSQKIV